MASKLWKLGCWVDGETGMIPEGWPLYDAAFSFVVVAPSEAAARVLASKEAGDEGPEAWLDSTKTYCLELVAGPHPYVVVRDFHAG